MPKVTEPSRVPTLVNNTLTGVMRFDAFDHLYTEPRIALLELEQRRADMELYSAVRQSLGIGAEKVLKKFKRPRAVFFRQVATPSHETLRFLKMAKQMNLKPLIFEYRDDKFVSSDNRSKRALGKMPIYQYTGADGRDMVEYKTVCDFNASTGKKLKEVKCLNNEKLISFHHRLFKGVTKLNPQSCTVDVSDWFHSAGNNADSYYSHLLALFLRDGILFENFMPLRSESAFTMTVVMPAFDSLRDKYGVEPLIVRLLPKSEEMRQFWDAYPKKISRSFPV